MLRKVNVHQCEGKAFPFGVKALKRKPRKSGENQLPALSGGGGGRKTRSYDFSESLESTSRRPTQTCESRAGGRRTGPRQSLTSQNHSAPVRERGRLAASLPPFKSGTGLAPLREKTLLGQRRDPGSENRAGLPGRCRPALARTSRSNSSECQAAAAGQGEPPSPGGRASGGSASPVSLRPGAAPRMGRGPAAGEGPVGESDSPSVFTCRRGQGRRSPCRPPAGRALSRLWRPGHQAELAPHVAGRASFTAQPGGGGAERARGSCDRRLASIGQAEPMSARARPGRPSPGTSAQRGRGRGEPRRRPGGESGEGGVSACATAVSRPCSLPYLMRTGRVLTQCWAGQLLFEKEMLHYVSLFPAWGTVLWGFVLRMKLFILGFWPTEQLVVI